MSNPYPFRRTVTLSKGSNFHQAHPGSSGPVRIPMKRSLVPTDDPHCYRDDELDSFKASIYRFGYASCPASHCRLSFLSLAGIVAHKKNCAGFLRQGDFVTCSFCEVRFCQFRSLRTHQERSHGVPPLHPSEISPAHESLDKEQNSRLMAESRIASNARPRGRPGKYTEVRRETNEDFYELDYSYYSRHSSRYILLDNEPEEELSPSSASPPRIMKVRTTDGNILYVRPIAGVSGEQKEEENWSSSSSTSGSARSALKSYNDKSRRAHVGSSLESVDYDDDVKIEEEVSCTSRNSSSSSSSNASKKNSLEEQRAILEAYEEIVLRSEALAENAKKKIREKNELLKKEKDFKSWEEELRRREAKAQQTINEALFTLGSDSLDCTKEEDISHSPPSRRSAVVIDLCDDLDTHETNESYILPDSTRSVRSAGSTFSASSSSINEDNLSDSISLVASLAKESNVYSSPEPINAPPPLSTPDLSDASVAEPNRQKMISDQGDLTISSNGSNGDNLNSNCSTLKKQKKSGRSTNSLQRQLQQFLSSIDTSSLKTRRTCDASIEDSNSRLDLEDTQSLNINRQPSSSQGVGRIKEKIIAKLRRAEEEAKEVMDSPDLTQEHSNSPTDDKIDLEEHKISLSGSDSEETTTVVENTDSLSIQIEEVVSNSNLIQEPLETPKRTRRKKRTSKASYDKTSPSNTKKELRRSTRIPRVQNTPSIIEPELPKMERNKRQCTTTPRVQNTPPIIDPESSKKERNKRQCTTTTKGQNTPSIIEPESPKKERNKRQCTTKASGQNTQSIIEPELPKMERKKKTIQSTTTPRVQNTLSIIEPESQKMERNITQCTSTPLSKMTTKKTVTVGKRKRAIQLKDKLEATPDSKSSKSPPTKKAKVSPQLKCGKCDTIFESSQQFNVHVASRHGGVARLAGESQEFSNEEIQVSIKQAFRLVKKVLCYICGGSSFTTRLGLQYHIQRCGKTREELEAEMVPCSHCKYRGLPSGLKMHMKTHWELTEPTGVTHEENIDESLDVSSSGRVRRSAACKADKIMNETINSLLIIGEDGDVKNDKEDIDDEECTLCDFENKTRKSLVNHVLSAHSEEDEDQDHEDEFFEDEENSSDSADECDAIISRTPGARQSKPRHYNSTGRCPTLSPCMEHLKSELKFRIAHFSVKETLFRKIMSNEFQPVTNSSEADSYLPTSKHSISFTYKKSVDSQFSSKVTSLARFEVGSSHWEGEEFFAVCTHRDMDDVSAMFSLDFGLGVIQIWSSGVLKATCENASAPIFKYGILHDYGKIWCFKWCPSGTDTETDLGLLAAGCSNGNVYIHRIQRPKHDDVNKADSSPQFYKHAPEVCLRPLRESFGQCLKIAWYNGKEHRVIGAAYSEGKIALYDLLTSSILLKRGSVIHPYKVLHVHTSCVNALDLLGNDVFPRYCATGSFDRHFNVWDLNEPSFPILNGKKGLITDLHFFRSFSDGHISISHDDVYLQSHTQTILSEPGYSRVRTQPILCHNSAIKNEATNFWLGTLGVGTSAGEVIVFVSPSNASSLETDKYTTRRRTFVYRTSVSHKDNDKSSLKYEECKDNIEEFGYVDMNLDDFRKNPDSEISATRSADRLQLEDITRYPISAINRVSFNPNLRSCTWLLSGSQNGIGRLHNIRALQHVSYTTFLKTYIETFENRE
ncbi:GTF3C2 [Lepeophtheirus salmonis]|uniref:GTF3C2 n=1 Tax=Lepeophtheirus salmonis TaxID=72036 RepID=A0A7R8CC03_LEPSM|nr:GTF3C2 [Lepeophtheirus salmonis]CAF2766287.1 GTF3C2 [Lepeophtheirus salmonis]